MSAKKSADSKKIWKIAGEIPHTMRLSAKEKAQIAAAFYLCDNARSLFFEEMRQISRAEAKRNQGAAQTVAAFLCERYAGQYSIPVVVRAVAVGSAIPTALETQLNEQQDYLLGGALWLLDYLKSHCKCTSDYISLLPEPDNLPECGIPFIADLDHPWTAIAQTVAVLRGRRKRHRETFRSLLALIDDETAAHLRQTFMSSFLDYMDRSMKADSHLQSLKCDPVPCGENILSEQDAFSEPCDESPEYSELLIPVLGAQLICQPVGELQDVVPSKRAAELLSGYGTTDPYALCAAYLLLEYEQDALACISGLTAAVVSCAANHLPWTRDALNGGQELFDLAMPDYALRHEYQESCQDQGAPCSTQLASEAQLFFNATRVIMPRNRQPSQQLVQWFVAKGIAEQRARELAWGAMFASYTDAAAHNCADTYNDADAERRAGDAIETDQQEKPYDTQLIENQSAEIEALTQKIKELRGALHDAEKETNLIKDELHTATLRSETDRSELAQLRETLYNLRSGEIPEIEDDHIPVELPWQVKRRIAVFGGHDNWRRAVKSLLPGARFYGREVSTDLNVVRGADVIWLQVNSMSHSHYNRIIDIARTNGVSVRYFGSASPKKCAAQLALDEMEAERKRTGS